MGRSVVITTPIPTVDEMAKRLRIGKRRLAMIRKIARHVMETREAAGKDEAAVRTAAKLEEAAR